MKLQMDCLALSMSLLLKQTTVMDDSTVSCPGADSVQISLNSMDGLLLFRIQA